MPPVAEDVGGPGSSGQSTVPKNDPSAQPREEEDEEDEEEFHLPMTVIVQPPGSPKRVVQKMEQYSTDHSAAKEFFKKEPCLFSHRIFIRSSRIFDGLLRKDKEPRTQEVPIKMTISKPKTASSSVSLRNLDFRGPAEKKLTFELAFSAMRYRSVFEDILEDCSFFSQNPDLTDEEGLVMVVLWDYQSRKFQPRAIFQNEELDELVTCIERAIMAQKTKLAASLARRRIKASAPTIDYLLPENMRKQSSNQRPMPVYAWINKVKIHPTELMQKLRDDGFVQLWVPPKNLEDFEEKSFHQDTHCSNGIVFSRDCTNILQTHPLVEQGCLVTQDKSSLLAAHSIVPLLGDEQDVVVVNPGPGLLPAHVAVLLHERKCHVVVISEQNDEDHSKMLKTFDLLGVNKFIRVIREKFTKISVDEIHLRNVRAALINAECSKTAISNIVTFIVMEGENLRLMQNMTETTSDLEIRLNQLQAEHVGLLRHALLLHKIQGVTYVTRSLYEQENEAVVQQAIEYANMLQMPKKMLPWRVIPPVLPFTAEEIDEQIGIEDKVVRFRPSTMMNGCFIVAIAREPEDPADMMARARNKGTVSGGEKAKAPIKEGDMHSESNESLTSKTRRKSGPMSVKKQKVSRVGTSPVIKHDAPHKKSLVSEHLKVVKHPAPFR